LQRALHRGQADPHAPVSQVGVQLLRTAELGGCGQGVTHLGLLAGAADTGRVIGHGFVNSW
jgi:hypothetical protein